MHPVQDNTNTLGIDYLIQRLTEYIYIYIHILTFNAKFPDLQGLRFAKLNTSCV